ncbi:MAG: hypothetical protein FWH27_00920 [Planctomycetaceae bacterium]|nr:hypothetical protein [Planctomycetaceae bacterium]
MGNVIRTVCGDIPPDSLGHCQCHEHLFIEKGKPSELVPSLLMEDLEKTSRELSEYKKAGGGAVVDAQPVHCGRMAEFLVEASQKTGVHVIASTGFHKTVYYPETSYVFRGDEEEITSLYIREIEEGMIASEQSGAKQIAGRAGVIKTAVDRDEAMRDGVYEKLFSAAVHASKATGATILCHIEFESDALALTARLLKKDVPPQKIILCHLDRVRFDFQYHEECLRHGVYLEYDTINRTAHHDDVSEATLIHQILNAGYEKQILLGLDTTNRRLRNYGAGMGLDYIINDFMPVLKQEGMGKTLLDRMLVENPQEALGICRSDH